jgi:hypothetical protein
VEPAGVHVFLLPIGTGLDVVAVDPDGGRAQEAKLLGCRLVGDQAHPHLGIAGQLGAA